MGVHPGTRPFDVPWVVMDSTRARRAFHWAPEMTLPKILDEIAAHVAAHPEWLSAYGCVMETAVALTSRAALLSLDGDSGAG